MTKKKKRNNIITLRMQLQKINSTFPDGEGDIRKNFLVWEGYFQPILEARKYLMCLNYKLGEKPKIWVVEPPFHTDKSKELHLHHVYVGNRLCLSYPPEWKWNKKRYISNTILPWASLWLLYHETCEATGEWHGGGREPDEVSEENRKSKKRDSKKKNIIDKQSCKAHTHANKQNREHPECCRLHELRANY